MPMACAIFTPRICAPRRAAFGPKPHRTQAPSDASARWRLRYVLHVKGNPPNLAEAIQTWFDAADAGTLERPFWQHRQTDCPSSRGHRRPIHHASSSARTDGHRAVGIRSQRLGAMPCHVPAAAQVIDIYMDSLDT